MERREALPDQVLIEAGLIEFEQRIGDGMAAARAAVVATGGEAAAGAKGDSEYLVE